VEITYGPNPRIYGVSGLQPRKLQRIVVYLRTTEISFKDLGRIECVIDSPATIGFQLVKSCGSIKNTFCLLEKLTGDKYLLPPQFYHNDVERCVRNIIRRHVLNEITQLENQVLQLEKIRNAL
jgi:hypothetical protein